MDKKKRNDFLRKKTERNDKNNYHSSDEEIENK